MEATEFLIRLAIALCLGAAIGVERQVSHHMAGLKTNALVSTGAALFMVVAASLTGGDSSARLAGQIISGIGFLGGGVILRDGFHVRGLNTAATLWCAAGVGTLAGVGLLMQAAVGTAAVLAINVGLRPISERLGEDGLLGLGQVSSYQVQMVCRFENEEAVRNELLDLAHSAKLRLKSLKTAVAGTETLTIQAELAPITKYGTPLEELVRRTNGFTGVSSVEWKTVV
jgi:putative Mg2+ transporter-C (MgtC) family protein